MKERQDLREVEKELEKEDVLSMFPTTRPLWQRRNIMASSSASEGQPIRPRVSNKYEKA